MQHVAALALALSYLSEYYRRRARCTIHLD